MDNLHSAMLKAIPDGCTTWDFKTNKKSQTTMLVGFGYRPKF